MKTANIRLWVILMHVPTVIAAVDQDKNVICDEIANKIEKCKNDRNVPALDELGYAIKNEWINKDKDIYGRAISMLVNALVNRDYGQYDKQRGLAQIHAINALADADALQLEIECELLGHVQCEYDGMGETIKGDNWKKLRKQSAKLWLHAWQRIEKTIDKNWDPNDRPFINVPPPLGGGESGMSPDDIKDPQLRAQYVVAIEDNRKKAMRCYEQITARRLKEHWVKDAQRHIIRVYMEPPEAKDELKQLLDEYGIDAETRTMLLDAVEKKEIPKQLETIVTTQPATRPE